jgi:hypothetical protein
MDDEQFYNLLEGEMVLNTCNGELYTIIVSGPDYMIAQNIKTIKPNSLEHWDKVGRDSQGDKVVESVESGDVIVLHDPATSDLDIEDAIKDLTMLYGLPPHNGGGNFLNGDGYFAASLEKKYAMSVDKLIKATGFDKKLQEWNKTIKAFADKLKETSDGR